MAQEWWVQGSCECIKLTIVDSGGGTSGSLNPGMDLGFFQLN